MSGTIKTKGGRRMQRLQRGERRKRIICKASEVPSAMEMLADSWRGKR